MGMDKKKETDYWIDGGLVAASDITKGTRPDGTEWTRQEAIVDCGWADYKVDPPRNHPDYIGFTFWNLGYDIRAKFQKGDTVCVNFTVKGAKWPIKDRPGKSRYGARIVAVAMKGVLERWP